MAMNFLLQEENERDSAFRVGGDKEFHSVAVLSLSLLGGPDGVGASQNERISSVPNTFFLCIIRHMLYIISENSIRFKYSVISGLIVFDFHPIKAGVSYRYFWPCTPSLIISSNKRDGLRQVQMEI